MYRALQRALPAPIHRYLLFFEAAIENAVQAFAEHLPPGTRVLDAGAGEGAYAARFAHCRYTGLDLGVGDAAWNYGRLDVLGDLQALPFPAHTFDACLNVVTLEHVRNPALVLAEISRSLCPHGELLLIVPHEWEEHQIPHDYYRYTRYGLRHLLEQAGLTPVEIRPVGGYFRLMSRRLLNGLQFFPAPLLPLAALLLAPPALLFPLLDKLDRAQHFTLGFICVARKQP